MTLTLNDQYRTLLGPLAHDRAGCWRSYNDRTGEVMVRQDGPKTLSIDLADGVPVPRWRRLSPHIPFADTIWQMMATTDLSWLNTYAAFIWGPYSDDGHLSKAYGSRWWWQLDLVVDHLKNDPTSRQVYMSTWDPAQDLTTGPRSPMPPCLIGLQFKIAADRLETTVYSRSCDIIVGLPHDLMNMCFLTHLVANELGIRAGQVHFMFADLHLYDMHRRAAYDMVGLKWQIPLYVSVPVAWTRHTVTEPGYRDNLVTAMRDNHRQVLADTAPLYKLDISR